MPLASSTKNKKSASCKAFNITFHSMFYVTLITISQQYKIKVISEGKYFLYFKSVKLNY